jgi:hypothetical protein
LDEGINKSKIDQDISDLDSTDKKVSSKAFNFLLSRVGIEITDYQDQVRIENKLVELASSTDMEVRRHVGNMCNTIICNTNPELALTLAILSETEDNALRNEIKSNRAFIGSNHPIRCLEIIQRWWRTNMLPIEARLCGILQDIAEGDANEVHGFLRSWIAEENEYAILTFGLPDLLRDMFYHTHKTLLLDLLVSTDLNDERQLKVVCRTLNTVLTDLGNFPQRPDQDFVANSLNFVSTLAKSKDINIAKIEPGAKNMLIKILAIIDSIEKPKRNVDFVAVNNNLYCFPHIKYLLNQRKWFDRAINRKDASHPLISLLEMKNPGDSATLTYIDKALALFVKDKNARLGEISKGFEAAGQFFSTVQELVVCAHFKSSFQITEMQFQVRGKVLDCKVKIDEKDVILVEIKSLELLPELKYSTTKANIERNRLKDAIKKKLNEQIHPIANATKMPIFIALNITEAIETDDIDIDSLFHGSWLYEPVRTPQGKIEVIPSRAQDSIAHKEENKIISGIIICQADFTQMKLYGIIRKVPQADKKVEEELIEKIKKGIFDKRLPESVSS